MEEICVSIEESSTVLRLCMKMGFVFTVLVQCSDSNSAKITLHTAVAHTVYAAAKATELECLLVKHAHLPKISYEEHQNKLN